MVVGTSAAHAFAGRVTQIGVPGGIAVAASVTAVAVVAGPAACAVVGGACGPTRTGAAGEVWRAAGACGGLEATGITRNALGTQHVATPGNTLGRAVGVGRLRVADGSTPTATGARARMTAICRTLGDTICHALRAICAVAHQRADGGGGAEVLCTLVRAAFAVTAAGAWSRCSRGRTGTAGRCSGSAGAGRSCRRGACAGACHLAGRRTGHARR